MADSNSELQSGHVKMWSFTMLIHCLQGSDHPGKQLTNTKLNRPNFLQWSCVVKIALLTKVKLGFIDGTCSRAAATSPLYEQWLRCDSMVVSWLLNFIDPSLSGAFIYVNSAKEL